MKRQKYILSGILTVFLSFTTIILSAQSGDPWTSKDLMAPETLATMIGKPNGQKPIIFNIGPLDDIKGAINIGSTNKKANLDKLTKALAGVPKDKMVVIYCGCCPFKNCPNIRPAFNLLKEQGFKNPKLLNLSHNLKVDWTDPGYPMN